MPTGLKSTSSPIQISSSISSTAPAGSDLFLSKAIDLQLNPLDNEVFVVTGLKIDFVNGAQKVDVSAAGSFDLFQRCSVSKTALTAYRGIDSNTVIGASDINAYLDVKAGPPITVDQYVLQENGAMDAPPATQDYLDIIATNDFYLNFLISDKYLAGTPMQANVRLYGYRATASSSVYAALVQSEMLSS